jgi:predicted nucleic acid-binding Zn ribbon protein
LKSYEIKLKKERTSEQCPEFVKKNQKRPILRGKIVLMTLFSKIALCNRSFMHYNKDTHTQSQTIKERAYQTLIRPKLEYCCNVWDPHTNENINSLEKVQRRAARYTCNRHHNTSSVSEMLNTMNWQTLQERRLRTRLIMFHKVINENIAIPTQNILLQSQSMTRSSRKDAYRQIQCSKDSYKFSFFYFYIY